MVTEQDGNMVDISTIKTISNEEYGFLIKQSLELDKLKSK